MSTAVPRSDAERCTFIRWKGMFIDVTGARDPVDLGDDHICWCLQTQNCMGPDGQVVGEDICNPFRTCYQPA